MDQRRREYGALAHAVRIAFGEIVDKLAEAEFVNRLGDALPAQVARQSIHIGNELEEFAAGQLFIEIRLIRNVAEELAGAVAVGVQVEAADAARCPTWETTGRRAF